MPDEDISNNAFKELASVELSILTTIDWVFKYVAWFVGTATIYAASLGVNERIRPVLKGASYVLITVLFIATLIMIRIAAKKLLTKFISFDNLPATIIGAIVIVALYSYALMHIFPPLAAFFLALVQAR